MNNQKSELHKYFDEFLKTSPEERRAFFERVAKETGRTFNYCKRFFYITNKVQNEQPKSTAGQIKQDRELIKHKTYSQDIERKYKHLLAEVEEYEKRFDAMLKIKEDLNIPKIIPKDKNDKKNIATPVILLSDWHFEETVEARTINNINEYNLTIAEKRWFNCIQNSLRLIQIDRSHSEIKNLVVWLGGDFITGYIHEELTESNSLSPTQASRFAKKSIIAALEFYLKHGNFDTIDVVCSFGNHGRTTMKKRIGTAYKNSYEWMIYHDIADYFCEDNRVRFTIPDGYFTYLTIYDYVCRFWHGDTIKYQGGIGGLTVPLIKAILRYDMQIQADYNFMGHYHQLFQATKNCIVNGSGIGFNAYAQNIGASPEDPMQSYCLIDQKRGMTIKTPIFC
jgi:hypothetical protein